MTDDATAKTGITVSALENGTYSLTLPGPGDGTPVVGTVVFCIDLLEYAKQLTGIDATALKTDAELAAYNEKIATTVRATVTSVMQDGVELELDASKVAVGDTEANGNLRIELYNMYGPTAENAAVEPDSVEFTEALTINFNVELAELSATEKIEWPAEEPVETPAPTAEPTEEPDPTAEPTETPVTDTPVPTEAPAENAGGDVDVSGNVDVPKSNAGMMVAIIVVIIAVIAVIAFLRMKKKK